MARVVRRDPMPEPGPALRVLPPKWRDAVEALFLTEGDQTKAARMAGYGGKPASLKVTASRLFNDDRVRRAIKEECNRRIDTAEPELLAVVRGIMRNNQEKAADRLRAASMVWDRANPVMTKHKIEVEHHLTDDERDVQHWHGLKKLGAPPDAFIARFGPNGLARVEALVLAEEAKRREIEGSNNSIEVDYVDVTEATAELPAFDEELLS
jgi:hypothetical protein